MESFTTELMRIDSDSKIYNIKSKYQIYTIKKLKNIIEENDKIIADFESTFNENVNINVGKIIFELNGDRVIKIKFLDLNNDETLIEDNTEFFNKVDNIKCGKIEKINDSIKFYLVYTDEYEYYKEINDVYIIDNKMYVGFDDDNKYVYVGFKNKNGKVICNNGFVMRKDAYWFFLMSNDNEYIKFKIIETIDKLEKENKTIKEILLNIKAIEGYEK